MTTAEKTCFRCKVEKPMTEFYRHPMMADGHLGKCKDCTKTDTRANRRKNQDYYMEYDRKRGNRQPHGYLAEYRERNREADKARTTLGNAVRDGKVIREPCFMCGTEENIHGHHPDYTKPLSVVWLCAKCHKRIHAYEDMVDGIRSSTCSS